jgi:hypothetical protein
MSVYELEKMVEFSDFPEFWEGFKLLGYGQAAAFYASVTNQNIRGNQRKKQVLLNLKRFCERL